jgi:uncharacterized protein (TIGR02611 family)
MRYERIRENWRKFPHPIRWLVTAILGVTLIALGIIFLVLPGPGIPLIIAGLAILATEFTWAEILLNKSKLHLNTVIKKARPNKTLLIAIGVLMLIVSAATFYFIKT